jgi:hypothetical protein
MWFLCTTETLSEKQAQKGIEHGSKGLGFQLHTHLHTTAGMTCSPSFAAKSDYFKFIVIRNPWARLVSAYVDKFRGAPWENPSQPIARPVIESVQNSKGQSVDYREGITFREFVEYVCQKKDQELDGHWKPQHCFFQGVHFDFVARVEHIQEDFDHIQSILKTPYPLPSLHRQAYRLRTGEFAADLPLRKLRSRAAPHYLDFYSEELHEMVEIRYKHDIELYAHFSNCKPFALISRHRSLAELPD